MNYSSIQEMMMCQSYNLKSYINIMDNWKLVQWYATLSVFRAPVFLSEYKWFHMTHVYVYL